LPSGRLVLVEAAVGAAVLSAAALLLETAPATGTASTPAEPILTRSATVDDLLVTVSVTPNLPGTNLFTVVAASTRRPPPARVDGVALQASAAGRAISVPLKPVESRWFGTVRLSRPGSLPIRAIVTRADQQLVADVPWRVSSPGGDALRQRDVNARHLAPYTDGLAIAVLVGVFIVGEGWLLRALRRRMRTVGPAPAQVEDITAERLPEVVP
jgi:copper transport protein